MPSSGHGNCSCRLQLIYRCVSHTWPNQQGSNSRWGASRLLPRGVGFEVLGQDFKSPWQLLRCSGNPAAEQDNDDTKRQERMGQRHLATLCPNYRGVLTKPVTCLVRCSHKNKNGNTDLSQDKRPSMPWSRHINDDFTSE